MCRRATRIFAPILVHVCSLCDIDESCWRGFWFSVRVGSKRDGTLWMQCSLGTHRPAVCVFLIFIMHQVANWTVEEVFPWISVLHFPDIRWPHQMPKSTGGLPQRLRSRLMFAITASPLCSIFRFRLAAVACYLPLVSIHLVGGFVCVTSPTGF